MCPAIFHDSMSRYFNRHIEHMRIIYLHFINDNEQRPIDWTQWSISKCTTFKLISGIVPLICSSFIDMIEIWVIQQTEKPRRVRIPRNDQVPWIVYPLIISTVEIPIRNLYSPRWRRRWEYFLDKRKLKKMKKPKCFMRNPDLLPTKQQLHFGLSKVSVVVMFEVTLQYQLQELTVIFFSLIL